MIYDLIMIREAVSSTALENNWTEEEQEEILNKLIKQYFKDRN